MNALLVLEDGFALSGKSFTGDFETGGEVIFSTGMSGYQEALADPSHHGQMLCMTYPHIGNYGTSPEDMESSAVHAAALLVKECCKKPSNWRSTMSLPDFLEQYGTPGMEGLDTRALARHLRINGAMRGVISTRTTSPDILREKALALPLMKGSNLAPSTAPKAPYAWHDNATRTVTLAEDGSHAWGGAGLRLLVYDFGLTWSVLRALREAGFEPLAVPPTHNAEAAVKTGCQAVFLSGGPGDPAAMPEAVAITRELIRTFPVAGIGLGHQIIGLALGARTEKLKFGHHGCNHPVRDVATGHVAISAQNHGFHVLLDDAPDLEATHVNLNDRTLEGLRHKKLPVMSMQYHPGAVLPHDDSHLFNRFREMAGKAAGS